MERCPDLVLRRLVRRIEKDHRLNKIFEGITTGEIKLEDVETLGDELDSVCEENAKEEAGMLVCKSNTPGDFVIKGGYLDRQTDCKVDIIVAVRV